MQKENRSFVGSSRVDFMEKSIKWDKKEILYTE